MLLVFDQGTPNERTVHVCAPRATMRFIIRPSKCGDPKCPTHEAGRRPFLIGWHEEWYGPTYTCLSCGRQWMDGEWIPLMFERGARKKSIDAAKEYYKRLIKAGITSSHEEWRAMVEREMGDMAG